MNKKQQAQYLYMDGKTHKEIADAVGVSERTVFTWIHSYAWDRLRLAAWQGPATIANNLCSQIVELQNSIAAREPGKRFPTSQEAEISRKLIVSLEKMKKYPSISQTMQILETFRNYMRPIDKDFTRSLTNYTNRFLNGESVNGFIPYQVEYGVNGVAPISSFYDEADNADTRDMENPPCTDCNNCLHPNDCFYPKCKYPASQPNPAAAYNITPNCHRELVERHRESAEQLLKTTDSNLGVHNSFDLTSPSERPGEAPSLTAKTGSNPATLSSVEVSKSKKQKAEIQDNTACITHSTSPTPVMVSSPNQEKPGEAPSLTAKTGSNPAISISTEASKPKNQEAEIQDNTEHVTHSTSPSPSERAGERLADIMNLPPAERPSPYRDGDILWVNHIDDADEYRDNFGRLWGERKIGDTVRRYPDVEAIRKRA
jgi:DNA-binding XRE family transcriptional regulator